MHPVRGQGLAGIDRHARKGHMAMCPYRSYAAPHAVARASSPAHCPRQQMANGAATVPHTQCHPSLRSLSPLRSLRLPLREFAATVANARARKRKHGLVSPCHSCGSSCTAMAGGVSWRRRRVRQPADRWLRLRHPRPWSCGASRRGGPPCRRDRAGSRAWPGGSRRCGGP